MTSTPENTTLLRAKSLRKDMTPAERRLWALLRAKRFASFKFRRQHPVEPYIVDFYCPAKKLVIELDGSQHAEEKPAARDEARTRYLESHGIRVVRFWNNDFLREESVVLEAIWASLHEKV